MSQNTSFRPAETPRERILHYAVDQFRRKGVRGVRMDDMALGLGISKRTLYEMFGNKENLLLESMKYKSREYEARYQQFAQEALSPVEIYVQAVTMQLRDINNVNPALMSESMRYAPVRQFIDEGEAQRHDKSALFLQRCVDEGYLRKDLNIELMLRLQYVIMHAIMDEELYKEFPLAEIIFFVSYMNFRGQCTEKGLQELHRCMETIHQQEAERTAAKYKKGKRE